MKHEQGTSPILKEDQNGSLNYSGYSSASIVGNSRAYLADCMVMLKQTPDKYYDLSVVDPPYGIDINMNMGRRKGKAKVHKEKAWDKGIPDGEYFEELFRVSKHQIIWGGNYFPLPNTKAWIFWDKMVPDGVSFADGELAWTSFDKTLVKVAIQYTGFNGLDVGGKQHPTQKPVKLYKWLLKRYANPGDKILDTHLGSGSSRIAAYDLGFDFTGFELDPDYFTAQEKRFKNHISQLTIFNNDTARHSPAPLQEARQDLQIKADRPEERGDS